MRKRLSQFQVMFVLGFAPAFGDTDEVDANATALANCSYRRLRSARLRHFPPEANDPLNDGHLKPTFLKQD